MGAPLRPSYDAEELTFARADGQVLVHYVMTGVDAVPAADLDGDGVPDFVAEVADRADQALARFEALGFRAPLPDEDGAIDVYLRDLELADGSFGVDGCTEAPHHCVGYLVVDNDFARFDYPSVSLAIRTLTSHELFHGVQAGYDADQPARWSEGSAVWAEEVVFPEQHDFERLVAGFLTRTYRPFDRDGGGFGDPYPYGAALWPYYLEHRFGAEIVPAIWLACEDGGDDPDFLDAADAVLAGRGESLAGAWIEFTRWNAETGAHAEPGRYPDAARFVEAPREPVLSAPGSASLAIEGMSARYLPVVGAGDAARIAVDAEMPVAVAVRAPGAEVVRDADVVAPQHQLDVLGAGVGFDVIVTGVARGGLPRDVVVTVGAIPDPEPPPPSDGGCTAGPAGGSPLLLLALLGVLLSRMSRTRP